MNEEEAKKLLFDAKRAVARLTQAAQHPAVTRLLQTSEAWPILVPARKGERKKTLAQLDERGFAAKCELNVRGKYRESAPMTKVVLMVFDLIRPARKTKKAGLVLRFNASNISGEQNERWKRWVAANASTLPNRLTKENSPEWADATEPLLRIFWGVHFESHPDFRPYGKHCTPNQILQLWKQSWNSVANPPT